MGGYVGQMGSRIRVELNTLSEPQDRTHSSRATLCQERTLLSPPSPRAASFSKLMLRDTRILQKKWIANILDVTSLVKKRKGCIDTGDIHLAISLLPQERPYKIQAGNRLK